MAWYRRDAPGPHVHAITARVLVTPAEVARVWPHARPGITAPIARAAGIEQMRHLGQAASLDRDAALVAARDAASA
jgi:aryl-alcohol dehydrogenase-like predicted oxidoreductase